jgi:hypothetical protein
MDTLLKNLLLEKLRTKEGVIKCIKYAQDYICERPPDKDLARMEILHAVLEAAKFHLKEDPQEPGVLTEEDMKREIEKRLNYNYKREPPPPPQATDQVPNPNPPDPRKAPDVPHTCTADDCCRKSKPDVHRYNSFRDGGPGMEWDGDVGCYVPKLDRDDYDL